MNNADSLLIAITECDQCAVHEGFLEAYHQVAPAVLENVLYVLSKHPGAAIWVTGTSPTHLRLVLSRVLELGATGVRNPDIPVS